MAERLRGIDPQHQIDSFDYTQVLPESMREAPLDPQLNLDPMPENHRRIEARGGAGLGVTNVEAFLDFKGALNALPADRKAVVSAQLLEWHERLWPSITSSAVDKAETSRQYQRLLQEKKAGLFESEEEKHIRSAFLKWEALVVGMKRLADLNETTRKSAKSVAASDNNFNGVPDLNPTNKETGYDFALLFCLQDMPSILRGEDGMTVNKILSRIADRVAKPTEDTISADTIDTVLEDEDIRSTASSEMIHIARTMAYVAGFHPELSYKDQKEFVRKKAQGGQLTPGEVNYDLWMSNYGSYGTTIYPYVANKEKDVKIRGYLSDFFWDSVPKVHKKKVKRDERNAGELIMHRQDSALIYQILGSPDGDRSRLGDLTIEDFMDLADQKAFISYKDWVQKVAAPAAEFFGHYVDQALKGPIGSEDVYDQFYQTGVGVNRYGLNREARYRFMLQWGSELETVDYILMHASQKLKTGLRYAEAARGKIEDHYWGAPIIQGMLVLPFVDTPDQIGERTNSFDSPKRLRTHLIDAAGLDMGVARKYGFEWYKEHYKLLYRGAEPVIGGVIFESQLHTFNSIFREPKKDAKGKWNGAGVKVGRDAYVRVTYQDLLQLADVHEEVLPYEYEPGKYINVRHFKKGSLAEDQLNPEVEKAIRRWVNGDGGRSSAKDVLGQDVYTYNQFTRVSMDALWEWYKRWSPREWTSPEFRQKAKESRLRGSFSPVTSVSLLENPNTSIDTEWRWGVDPIRGPQVVYDEVMDILANSPFLVRLEDDKKKENGEIDPYTGQTWIFRPHALADAKGRALQDHRGQSIQVVAVPDQDYVDPVIAAFKVDKPGYMSLHTLQNRFPGRANIMAFYALGRGAGNTLGDEDSNQTGAIERWPIPPYNCKFLVENNHILVKTDFSRHKHHAEVEAEARILRGESRYKDPTHRNILREAEIVWRDQDHAEHVADPLDIHRLIEAMKDRDLIDDVGRREMMDRFGCQLVVQPTREGVELYGNLAQLLDVMGRLNVSNPEFDSFLKAQVSSAQGLLSRGVDAAEQVTPNAGPLVYFIKEVRKIAGNTAADFVENTPVLGGVPVATMTGIELYTRFLDPAIWNPSVLPVGLAIGIGLPVLKTFVIDRSGGYEFVRDIRDRIPDVWGLRWVSRHLHSAAEGVSAPWQTIAAAEKGVLVNNFHGEEVSKYAPNLVTQLDRAYGAGSK